MQSYTSKPTHTAKPVLTKQQHITNKPAKQLNKQTRNNNNKQHKHAQNNKEIIHTKYKTHTTPRNKRSAKQHNKHEHTHQHEDKQHKHNRRTQQ